MATTLIEPQLSSKPEHSSHEIISTLAATTELFEPFVFPHQQNTADFGLPWTAEFPLAVQYKGPKNLSSSISAVHNYALFGKIRELARQHGGAILFRGFPIETPLDYSKVAHAFGFRPHTEVGRPPLRTVLAPNVKTANEGYVLFFLGLCVFEIKFNILRPPELPIWPHNEYGWSTINPAWLTFSALKIPEEGTMLLWALYYDKNHHLAYLNVNRWLYPNNFFYLYCS